MPAKNIILFFGPPGSGKGTQADMLGEELNLPVISPGELLRHERDSGTKVGKEAAALMAGGQLVPDNIIETILDKRLAKDDTVRGFVLDGYPRRNHQLGLLIRRLQKIHGKENKIIAIYLKADDEKIKARIGGRRVCDCGAAYHLETNPPWQEGICDNCGEKLYQRKDDVPKVLAGRLTRFHKRVKPILKYFRNESALIQIDGDQSIGRVKEDIHKKLKNYLSI